MQLRAEFGLDFLIFNYNSLHSKVEEVHAGNARCEL